MAAPRTSSFKVLRNLQKASSSVPAKRSLHITGANSYPRPLEFSQKHSYAPLSIQTLRSECSKRSLTPSGTKHELVEKYTDLLMEEINSAADVNKAGIYVSKDVASLVWKHLTSQSAANNSIPKFYYNDTGNWAAIFPARPAQ